MNELSCLERELLLHLLLNPQAVYRVRDVELSSVVDEFVDRLLLCPTLAMAIGTANAIEATVGESLKDESALLRLLIELDNTTEAELRQLRPFSIIEWELQSRAIEVDDTPPLVFLPAPPQRQRIERLGALKQWQTEVSAGLRNQKRNAPSTWISDELWRAACYEAAALESERSGFFRAAEDLMGKAVKAMNPKRQAA